MTADAPGARPRSVAGRVGVAAAIWSVSILLARFIGLARELVIGRTLGVSAEADVYFAAFTIPDFLNYLLAGGLLSLTFIPIFTRYRAEGREDRGWDSFSDVANFLLLVGVPLTAAVAWAAPTLVRWVAPGFDPAQLDRLALLTRIILPGQVFIMLGALVAATLQARDRHAVPALAPSAYTLLIIGFGLALHGRLGAEGFAWGVLAGAALGSFGIPLLASVRLGMRWRPRLRLSNPDFKQYLWLSLPVMVGQSIVVVDQWLWKWQGSQLETGAVSWLQYAKTLLNVPSGVFGMAAGAAAYPTLVALLHQRKAHEFWVLLLQSARLTLLLACLSQVLLAVLGEDLVGLVWGFSNPRFTARDVGQSALCLTFFSLSLGAWSLHPLLARGFYAMDNTWTPTVIGTVVTVAAVPLYIQGRAWGGAPGLALASSLAMAVYIVPLYLVLRRRMARAVEEGAVGAGAAAGAAGGAGGADGAGLGVGPLPGLGSFAVRAAVATGVAWGALWAMRMGWMRGLGSGGVAGAAARVVALGLVSLPVFELACRIVGIGDAVALRRRIVGGVRRRLGRPVGGPTGGG